MNRIVLYLFIGFLISIIFLIGFSFILLISNYNFKLIHGILFSFFSISFFGLVYNLVFLQPKRKLLKTVHYEPITNPELTVVLTAYNDELSIQDAVLDFKNHPNVKRVIVVSNNSKDRTIHFAEEAGAIASKILNSHYFAKEI
jgi:hypothetical protein